MTQQKRFPAAGEAERKEQFVSVVHGPFRDTSMKQSVMPQ